MAVRRSGLHPAQHSSSAGCCLMSSFWGVQAQLAERPWSSWSSFFLFYTERTDYPVSWKKIPVFCNLQLLVCSHWGYFLLDFHQQEHPKCWTSGQAPCFLLSWSPGKGHCTLGIRVGLHDNDWASVWFCVSFHSTSLQFCRIIMYTFPPINLPFTLGIGFFSVSQNRHFDHSPRVIAVWGRMRRGTHLFFCSTLPHPSATADSHWSLLQHILSPLSPTSRVGTCCSRLLGSPHLSPVLRGHCLCPCGIRGGV